MLSVDRVVKQLKILHGDSTEATVSFEIAETIVDSIDIDWADPKSTILDPVCGRGMFLLAAYKRFLANGHKPKHIIKNMLYGVDINSLQCLIARRALRDLAGVEPNIEQADSLTKEWNMEFSAVVGNPPYQNGENSDFYKQFIAKSQELSSVVAFVVPATHFRTIKSFESISKYRYLGSVFKGVYILTSWFVWNKGHKGSTTIYGNNKDQLNETEFHITPTDNLTAYRFASGIVKRKWPGHTINSGNLHRREVILDPNGVKCIWGAGRRNEDLDWVMLSATLSDRLAGFGEHKVVFSGDTNTTSIGAMKYADPTYGCANKAHYIRVNSQAEADNLIGYLESKFVTALIPQLKGMTTKNSVGVFNKIPSVDVSRPWTDQEIYDYFKLTQDEIDYVERIK
jgi:predicted RNA methylase